jgi:hypothetical protein
MRTVCLVLALLLGAVAVTATALARPGQQPPDLPPLPTPGGALPPLPTPAPPQYVLKVGDTMRLADGTLGCQVTRRAGHTVIECRPAGALRGRYGTFLSDRTLTVARFRTKDTAQIVFTARHKRGWRACGKSSRAAHPARTAGGCR